jgi:hypothetical protein
MNGKPNAPIEIGVNPLTPAVPEAVERASDVHRVRRLQRDRHHDLGRAHFEMNRAIAHEDLNDAARTFVGADRDLQRLEAVA